MSVAMIMLWICRCADCHDVTSDVEEQRQRTVVAAKHVAADDVLANVWQQLLGHDKVIQAPGTEWRGMLASVSHQCLNNPC